MLDHPRIKGHYLDLKFLFNSRISEAEEPMICFMRRSNTATEDITNDLLHATEKDYNRGDGDIQNKRHVE
jgi:hypothetical protein